VYTGSGKYQLGLQTFYTQMNAYFNNKVVVVTGGSDGIGKALVDQLLAMGAKVATCGRSHDKLYQLQVNHPSQPLHTMVADMGVAADCERFITSTISTFGGIDILINNAGISMRALFKDLEPEVTQKVMDINFFGSLYCTKHALSSIVERKGDIIGISSIAGNRGLPGRSAYCASKFALQGWLESLRTELKPQGVNVLWISPGFTSSNIRNAALNSEGKSHGESPMDENRMMSSDTCATHILRAITKRKRTLVLTGTGKRTVFMSKFFPRLTDKLLHRFFFSKTGELIR
jgi:short-subunit dehydrogenase